MSICEELKRDHSKSIAAIEDLMKNNRKDKEIINKYKKIKNHINIKMLFEENVLYQSMKYFSHNGVVTSRLQEHRELRMVLKELELCEVGTDLWKMGLHVLRNMLAEHIEKEEDEIFTLAHEAISTQELQNMGKAYSSWKKEKFAEM